MSRRIAVLGGGISGLAAAWNLTTKGASTRGLEVVLYEASNRVGGWMKTERSSEGAVFECGPRSLRTAGPPAKTTMKLVSSIGLDSEVLPVPAANIATQKRLIYTEKNGLVEAPSGPSWVFRTKPPFTKPLLGAVMREIFTQPGVGDETVYDFFTRRTSSELADYLIDPLCRGVFASSPKSLSMKSCFPYFVEYEKDYGSLLKGMLMDKPADSSTDSSPLIERAKAEQWTLYSFKNGLQTLPDTLLNKVTEKGVKVNLDQPCSKLTFENGKAKVEAGGKEEVFDHVVSTISANALSNLLTQDVHAPLSSELASIPSVSVGVVGLEYKGQDVIPKEYREAFGYLVPSCEPARILGVVFDSASFPGHDRRDTPSTRLTVMLGGEWFSEIFGDPRSVEKSTLSQTALEELQKHLGITAQPSFINTMLLRDAISQYTIGHASKLESITSHVATHSVPLSICGASYRGVSVNDCIQDAIKVTDTL